MNETNQWQSESDIEALLPWYAAGTLEPHDADRVAAALAGDPELARRLALVREEIAETVIVNEALEAPSPRVMEKLFAAIDHERRTARAPRDTLAGWLSYWLTPRAFAFGASAAALVIALQAGVIARLALQAPVSSPPVFQPQSAPSAPATRGLDLGAFALVRFAPDASIAEVTRFLGSRDAAIVDGPRPGGAGGLYRVRIARNYVPRDQLERLVGEFQAASSIVATAMPTE